MRLPHSAFGFSAKDRFFMEEDNGGDATIDTDIAITEVIPQGKPLERVEGEQAPDFGSIGKKTAVKEASEGAEGGKDTQKPEKPAGEAPAKPAGQGKPVAKVAETVKKEPEAKKPEEKPKEKVAEPAKAAEKPAEKAKEPEAAKETVKIPETDDDIDALKPKPGAPTQVIKSFEEMRTRMKTERATSRAAHAEAEKLRAELATVKESTGKLPEDVQTELENLRKLSLVMQAENSPVFKKEFDAKISSADAKIYGLLEKHGLPKPVMEQIKAAAAGANGNIEAWPQLGELVKAFKNPVDQQEFLGALKGRRDVIGERDSRIAELGGSREKFLETVGKQEHESQLRYAKGVEDASIPLAAANEWIQDKQIPADATKEQREAIEAENAKVKELADQFGNNAHDIYLRDPAKVAAIALKAVEADYLREQLETVTKDKEKAAARVAELEKQLVKIRGAGRIAHVETPTTPTESARKTTEAEGAVGGDGHSALANWWANKC